MYNISDPCLCLFRNIPLAFPDPRKSMLTDVVRDVRAPSALGNAAEIRPIRNTIPATGPRYLIATVGKISSLVFTATPLV